MNENKENWYVLGEDDFDGIEFIEVGSGELPSPKFRSIAHVQAEKVRLKKEDWDNARLIAAAPDLYEACAELLEWHDALSDSQWEGSPVQVRAKEAIAKARGES